MNDSGAVWKSSGQNPGRRVNDLGAVWRKRHRVEKRSYLSGIVVCQPFYSFFLDLGSSGEEPMNCCHCCAL